MIDMKGKCLCIVSAKGGVGKTTVTANLGTIMAREFKRKVLMVDANFSAPNLSVHIGIPNPRFTIHDLLSLKKPIEFAIVHHELGFDVLPGSLIFQKVHTKRFKEEIQKIRQGYDVLLIDSSPSLKDEMLGAVGVADEILVVMSPDFPTLGTTLATLKRIKNKEKIAGIIVNRYRNKEFELKIDEIERATKKHVLGVIPEDENVLKSVSATTPVSALYPNSASTAELKKIAACLLGESYTESIWGKIIGLFRKENRHVHLNRLVYKHEKAKP